MASLFDTFSGKPVVDAAAQNRGILTQTGLNLINSTGQARDAAANQLTDAYGNARTDLGAGYGAATGAINTGAGGALGYLDQGINNATGALTANGGAYAGLGDLAARYGQGANLYADSLGINGMGGNDRATQAFQAGPGYEFALNQGLDAINRRRNAGGMLVGGNADRDAQLFGQGLANQEYGNWQKQLAGFNPLELSATQGAAAGNQANNQSLASLYNTSGQNKAQVAGSQGSSLADLARSYYGGLGQQDVGLGTGLAGNTVGANNTSVGIGMGLAPRIGQTYMDAANAEMQGSKNLWDFGLNAAKTAAGAAGGLNLSSLFSGPSGGKDFAGLGGWA